MPEHFTCVVVSVFKTNSASPRRSAQCYPLYPRRVPNFNWNSLNSNWKKSIDRFREMKIISFVFLSAIWTPMEFEEIEPNISNSHTSAKWQASKSCIVHIFRNLFHFVHGTELRPSYTSCAFFYFSLRRWNHRTGFFCLCIKYIQVTFE